MAGMVKHCGIDAENLEAAQEMKRLMILAFGKDEVVGRSLEQNDCLHKWCRVIRDHLVSEGVRITEETVKELILLKLGNTKEILGEKVAMRSSKYKQYQSDLTEAEQRAGFISMNELLEKVVAWAAMDLNLNLVEDEAA